MSDAKHYIEIPAGTIAHPCRGASCPRKVYMVRSKKGKWQPVVVNMADLEQLHPTHECAGRGESHFADCVVPMERRQSDPPIQASDPRLLSTLPEGVTFVGSAYRQEQYQLLHHAAAFARQLEAAGLAEAATEHMGWPTPTLEGIAERIVFLWLPRTEACVYSTGLVHWLTAIGREEPQRGVFTLGDPLPDALVAAIKTTELSFPLERTPPDTPSS